MPMLGSLEGYQVQQVIGLEYHPFFSPSRISRKKYEWVYEHVIVLDACYMNKCPTIMCLAKNKTKQKTKKGEKEDTE